MGQYKGESMGGTMSISIVGKDKNKRDEEAKAQGEGDRGDL